MTDNEESQSGSHFFAASLRPMNFKSPNLAKEWKTWHTKFKIFLRASNLESQSDQRKVALLLHHLGSESLDVFNSFDMDIDLVKYVDLVNKMDTFFTPQVNIVMERYKFFSCKQHEDQSIDEYVTVLKNLSLNCEFGGLREELVRDIFICGLSSKMSNVRERLLTDGNIKLEKSITIAKNMIMAKENATILQQDGGLDGVVNAVTRKATGIRYQSNYNNNSSSRSSNINNYNNGSCKRCGQSHKNKCPADGVKCHECGRMNHFARMCFSKNKFVKQVYADNESGEEEDDLFIGVVSKEAKVATEWNVEVTVNKKKIVCQIDTGAQANILSSETADMLKIKDILKNTSMRIFTFSGERIPVLGTVDLNIWYTNKNFNSKFFIVNIACKNIIGIETAIAMNLIKQVNSISINKLIEKYSDVFNGLGLLQNECNLRIRDNVEPIIEPPRKIPFKLNERLRKELDRMLNMKVITPVSEPTEWVNSIVLVTKPNGNLRICLDPRHLNKAILRPHFPFPNIEDCKSKLSGSKYFSALDANSGFWMVPLNEQSSKLCTFNTPFGRYRFLRLPFGINAAPEIFHAEMVKLFGDISGLVIYIDDFLIYSSNIEEHTRILETVFQRAKEVGLKFNKSKCMFFKTEIKFLGHIFNAMGVRPDDEKTKAILNMKKPNNVKEVQRFLGMVNYLGPFIENLSSKNQKLRELLKNEVQWHWSHIHDAEFESLKKEITMAPVLTYFNHEKKLILSVDASKFALGATILHDGQPIAYASVSLTDAQKNYAQIEKELFAILFGCTRFHQYVYGSDVTVETDHKPLVTLFDRPLFKIPPRLQRFMLRLQGYNLTVVYKPGRYLKIADTLSRAPLEDTALSEVDKEIALHCNFISSHLEFPFADIDAVAEHSRKDEIFLKIFEYVKNGWPDFRGRLEEDVKPYFKIKDEITVLNDMLLKNNQILIPKTLRRIVLNKIHEGHMGVLRCQNLARQSVYWPNIYNDIEIMVSNCEICSKYKNSNTRPELMPHEIVDIPWYKVGCDLFEFRKKMYLLVVDYYSKYVEIELLSSGYNSSYLILKLKSIFARHGVPGIIMSDNGPPFNSKDFAAFCQNWGIDHKTSSPFLPRSNGLAERSVQTIKKLLTKSVESNSDPYVALLHYRTTPKGNLPSPSELLMSRALRTKIPSILANFEPKLINKSKYRDKIETKVKKCSEYYNKKSKVLKPIIEGDKVMFKKTPLSCWLPGKIVEVCKEPRSFKVLDENGATFRRSHEHIKKTPVNEMNSEYFTDNDDSNNENEINSENIEKEEIVEQNLDVNRQNQSENYVTRKGRIVKQPERLNL